MWLTRAMLVILQEMVAAEQRGDLDDAEIVCDGICYLGLRRIHPGSVNRLLTVMAISDRSIGDKVQRYRLNDTGRSIVRRPIVVQEICHAVAQHKPFTIRNDRVELLP